MSMRKSGSNTVSASQSRYWAAEKFPSVIADYNKSYEPSESLKRPSRDDLVNPESSITLKWKKFSKFLKRTKAEALKRGKLEMLRIEDYLSHTGKLNCRFDVPNKKFKITAPSEPGTTPPKMPNRHADQEGFKDLFDVLKKQKQVSKGSRHFTESDD